MVPHVVGRQVVVEVLVADFVVVGFVGFVVRGILV